MAIRGLIVDDNKAYARMVELSLQSFIECTYVEDGHEAFRLYCKSLREGKTFDLIITDLMLPKDTGVRLVQQVRGMENKLNAESDSKMFMIVVTGFEDDDYMEKALASGADHCFFKSGGTAPIIAAIRKKFNIKE